MAQDPAGGTAVPTEESGKKDAKKDDKKDKKAENDKPPKIDVTLSLNGIPEYNQFPYDSKSDKFYFMATVKASFYRAEARAPIDLCCVVDESGSMSGDPIQLVRETLNFIVKNLDGKDRFGIVGYHSNSRVVLPLTKMDKKGVKNALEKISTLRPQGATALCDGLVDGIKMMRKRKKKSRNPISSVMLFTDGQANQGPRTADAICRAMRDPNYKASANDDFGGYYGQGQMRNFQEFHLQQQQVQQQVVPMQMQQRKSLKNLWGLIGNNSNDNNNNNSNKKKSKKNKKTKEKRRATIQSIGTRSKSNNSNNNSGIVSSPVDYSVGVEKPVSQQGAIPPSIDASVTGNSANDNNNNNNVSQPGLNSDDLATNTQKANETNNNSNANSNVTQPGAAATTATATTSQQDEKEKESKDEKDETNDNDDDDGDDNNNDSNNVSEDDLLPCTVYTFGFGTNHNAELLEKIAENGRGMYVFIQSKDMIAESFAECLGGLVSIVGKNLQLKLMALNDCKIIKCLSQGYKIEVSKDKLTCNINIHDIQSEEARDLVFEFSLPKIESENAEWPMAQLSCKYENVVKKKTETLSSIVKMGRINGQETGERNEELDLQHNRLMAAEAMENADNLAQSGKLKEARDVLEVASKNISASVSKNSKYSQALVEDIGKCSKNLSSHTQYENVGTKMLRMNKNAHFMQRSTQSSNYASQNMYTNSSKMSYMTSSKSHFS